MSTPQYKFWTGAEIKYVRDNYAITSAKAIARHLDRAPGAVHEVARSQAIRKRPDWTPEDTAYVLANYRTTPAKVLAAKLGRTPGAVAERARRLGVIKMPRK